MKRPIMLLILCIAGCVAQPTENRQHNLPTESQITEYQEALRSDNEQTRLDAIEALSKASNSDSTRILLGALSEGSFRVRVDVCEAFSNSHNKDAISALIESLGDMHVSYDAEKALKSIGRHAEDALLSALYSHSDRSIREICADLLSVVSGDQILNKIVLRGKSPRDADREWTAKCLGHFNNFQAKEALLKLLEDSSPKVRAAAAESLGCLKAGTAVEEIIKATTDRNSKVRESAVCALGKIGEEASNGRIRQMLLDGDGSVRIQSIASLMWIGADIGEEYLVNEIVGGGDSRSRETCIFALSRSKSASSLDLLWGIYNDENERMKARIWAACSLFKRTGKPNITAFYKPILQQGGGFHSSAAVQAMEEIDDRECFDLLVEMLNSDSHFLRCRIVYALEKSKFAKDAVAPLIELMRYFLKSINGDRPDMHDYLVITAIRKNLVNITGVDHKYFPEKWTAYLEDR